MTNRLLNWAAEEIQLLKDRDLLRDPMEFGTGAGGEKSFAGREVIDFSSNDYLGLAAAAFPSNLEASSGSGSSRLVSGNLQVLVDAERCLTEYLGWGSATLFSSGYATNAAVLPALTGAEDLILSDALNHASIIDGCRLSRAKTMVFPHRDTDAVARMLSEHRSSYRHVWLATDAHFSMDATSAPLARLKELAKHHDAFLYVDEAHSLGVFGPAGRGISASDGIRPDVLIGTLGKSFGLWGAFCLCEEPVTKLIRNRGRSFVYSTGVAPVLAQVLPGRITQVLSADAKRESLLAASTWLRGALIQEGLSPSGETASPIVPVVVGQARDALRVTESLLAEGLFVQTIRPPTVPEGSSRLRIVLSAAHTREQLEKLASSLVTALRLG